jgi:hypothetical protein
MKIGNRYPKSPEFSVEVVDATVMDGLFGEERNTKDATAARTTSTAAAESIFL